MLRMMPSGSLTLSASLCQPQSVSLSLSASVGQLESVCQNLSSSFCQLHSVSIARHARAARIGGELVLAGYIAVAAVGCARHAPICTALPAAHRSRDAGPAVADAEEESGLALRRRREGAQRSGIHAALRRP